MCEILEVSFSAENLSQKITTMLLQTLAILAVAVATASAAVLHRSPPDGDDELIASASEYGYGHSGDYGGPGYITKFPVGDIYGLGHDDYGHGGGYGHHSYHHYGPPVVYIPGKPYKLFNDITIA